MSIGKKTIRLFTPVLGKINICFFVGGFMVSALSAGQWTRSIGLGSIRIIWNLQTCENRVYATTNVDEIYFSDNRGKTWSAFNYQKYRFNAFLASGHNKYMLQDNTLYCGACKDTAWTPILQAPAAKQLFIEGESIYILKNDTFFVANLDGSDFRPLSPKLPFPIAHFAVAGQSLFVVNDWWYDTSGTKHEENLYRFGPADQSWVQLTERSFPDDIKAMAAAGGRIFAGTMKGLYVWSEADSALLALSNDKWVDELFSGFGKLIVAPWDPIKLDTAAMASAGIPADFIVANILNNETFRTAAGDSTLYILNETVNVGAHEAYSFHYDGSSFGSRNGLFASEVMGPGTSVDGLLFDGKNLWSYSKTGGVFGSGDTGKSWGHVGYFTAGEPRAFARLGAHLCLVSANNVYLSSDAGVNWVGADIAYKANRTFLDAFISGTDAFITSTNGFFKTADAGKTWTTIDQGAGTTGSCAVHGEDILFFTSDSIRQILHSGDGGATWKTAYRADSAGESFRNISASDAGALVYSSTRGILYSGDNGATWNPRNTGIADSMNINSLLCHQNSLLASTRRDSSWGGGWSAVRGDLFVWSDSGNSWVKKSIGKESMSTVWLTSVGPYIYAYAWASGQYNEIFLSPDGGKTWESLGAISYSDDHRQLCYSFSNEEFFVGCNGGLWRHPIANPVRYYTGLKPQCRVDNAREVFAVTHTLSGRTLRFRFPAGFGATPGLTILSVNGRKIADLRPSYFDGVAGTAAFMLGNAASGVVVYKFVLKDTVKNGVLVIPSL